MGQTGEAGNSNQAGVISVAPEAGVGVDVGRSKFRLKEGPPIPSAGGPPPLPVKTSATVPPPLNRVAQPPTGPQSIDEQLRPEDSKLFRLGVKFFFSLGIVFIVFLGWLSWYFIQHRTKAPGAAPEPAPEAAPVVAKPAEPVKKPEAAKPVAPTKVPVTIFEDFVSHLKISGVAQGARPKALINGSLYLPGQIIDPVDGIAIDRIDAERREIIFRNSKGELLKRRY